MLDSSLWAETLSAIQRAKASMLLDTAEGNYLSRIGQNYGISRGTLPISDELYRKLVQLLAWQPKAILFTVHKLLEVIFGTQKSYTDASLRPWRVYEVNANEIVIEIPTALLAGTRDNAAYMHGWSGYASVVGGPTTTFATQGDVRRAAGVTIVGMGLSVFHGGGWQEYTVVSVNYIGATDISTVTVNAASLPTGGGYFYLDVPGNDIASSRGDYLATGGFVGLFATAGGGATATILVSGDATRDVQEGHSVTLTVSGVPSTHTVLTRVYSHTTDRTTVVLSAATVAGGVVGGTIMLSLEKADLDLATPPHADRVYSYGLGVYELVRFYMDALVRAAGVVVRMEQI